MAEIELSVLARECLDRRIPDKVTLVKEVAAGNYAEIKALAQLIGILLRQMHD